MHVDTKIPPNIFDGLHVGLIFPIEPILILNLEQDDAPIGVFLCMKVSFEDRG